MASFKKILLICLCVLTSCIGEKESSDDVVINLIKKQKFNPNVVHGEISYYKLTITGASLKQPFVKFYSASETSATIQGFPKNQKVNVMVEYYNVNDVVVRRGYTGDVTIQAGKNKAVDIEINNVPIFANLRNGAHIVNTRFTPVIFAPGEIPFSVSTEVNGSESVLPDVLTNETSFSITSENDTSLRRLHPPILSAGEQVLRVVDPESGEASEVKVVIEDGTRQNLWNTTAGGFVGASSALPSQIKPNSLTRIYQQEIHSQ